MRQALRVELLRGTAPAAGLAVLVAAAWVFLAHPDAWAARVPQTAAYAGQALLVLCPVVVGAAAWHGGRDRRRGLRELLATMPRPPRQRLLVAWAALTAATTAALLLVWGAAALSALPAGSYAGGGWWWQLALCPVALGAAAALGLLVGTRVPLLAVAPLAAAATYVGLAAPAYVEGAHRWLLPPSGALREHDLLPGGTVALQAAWLAGLGAAGLLLAAARRGRDLLAVPLAVVVAAAGAAPLLTGPQERWRPDPAARALTCTADGRVCVTRASAAVLPEVAAALRPVLARAEGLPGLPRRAVEVPPDVAVPPGTARISLGDQLTIAGGLRDPAGLREYAVLDLRLERCAEPLLEDATSGARWTPEEERAYYAWDQLGALGRSWLAGAADEALLVDPEGTADRRWRALAAAPRDDQRAWMAGLAAVVRSCEPAQRDALLSRLDR